MTLQPLQRSNQNDLIFYQSIIDNKDSSVEDNVENDDTAQHHHHNFSTTVYYPQRWMVLLAFSWLSFMNNWIWITWSPFTPHVARYWDVSTSSVDDLSAVFMYVYIIMSVPFLQFLNVYKLRTGLIVGGCFNAAGAFVRYWGHSSFPWVYIGTVLCAMCQALTLAMPPLISTLWFREKERGLSTSLGVLANQLGSAVGLGATIVPVNFTTTNYENGTDSTDFINPIKLEQYLALQFILSVSSLALILVGVRSSAPPTPPSQAAAHLMTMDDDNNNGGDDDNSLNNKHEIQTPSYSESVGMVLSTKSGIALCIVYGMTVGVLYALATFLAQLFDSGQQHHPNGTSIGSNRHNKNININNNYRSWSAKEVGYLGLVLILVGVVGSLVAGIFLDEYRSLHRRLSIVLLLGSLGSMVPFLWLVECSPYNRLVAYSATGLLGFFLTAFISVGFEYGTAISYPADEAAVAGLLNVSAQIGGWVLVCIGGKNIKSGEDSNLNGAVDLVKVLGSTLVVALTLLSWLITDKNKRPADA